MPRFSAPLVISRLGFVTSSFRDQGIFFYGGHVVHRHGAWLIPCFMYHRTFLFFRFWYFRFCLTTRATDQKASLIYRAMTSQCLCAADTRPELLNMTKKEKKKGRERKISVAEIECICCLGYWRSPTPPARQGHLTFGSWRARARTSGLEQVKFIDSVFFFFFFSHRIGFFP
jgi:hypothetical protein